MDSVKTVLYLIIQTLSKQNASKILVIIHLSIVKLMVDVKLVHNILMQATNSTHGLAANNRKFYWNPIENYFEPINYDSNANINKDIPSGVFRYPISKNFYSSFNDLKIPITENIAINMITLIVENLSINIEPIIKKT